MSEGDTLSSDKPLASETGLVSDGGTARGGKLISTARPRRLRGSRSAIPAKRNALDHEILDAIAEAMPELDDGIETRCVVITGSDGMFSAGYDIGGIPDEVFAEEAERLVAHPFSRAIEAVEAFPFPTLAAINGHALGGGLELALACDLRHGGRRGEARACRRPSSA